MSFYLVAGHGASTDVCVLGDLEETDPAAEAAQQKLAGYALAEINRITTDLAQPV